MSKYDSMDELISDFEEGKLSLDDYVNEYNKIVIKESLKRMEFEKPDDREDI